MSADSTGGALPPSHASEPVPTAGLQVDEPAEVENIELTARAGDLVSHLGWETVRGDEDPLALVPDLALSLETEDPPVGPVAASRQELRLELENLRLAAELAALRSAAESRQQGLEAQLAALRERVAGRESELLEQSSQIASLLADLDALRAARARGSAARAGGDDSAGELRARLEQAARQLEQAGGAIRALEDERRLLASALAAREAELAGLREALARQAPPERGAGELRRVLGRLIGARPRGGDAADGPAGAEAMATATVVLGAPGADTPPAEAIAPARVEPAIVANRRYLIALDPASREVHELSAPRVYVGRCAEAGVRIPDDTVSRVHAILRVHGDRVLVEDAASTNGVYVNGTRVSSAELADFDTVTFGGVDYLFRVAPAAEGAGQRAQ